MDTTSPRGQAGPVRLLAPLRPEELPEPDEHSAAVLEAARQGRNLVVLGAPGTGRTTTALRLLVGAVTAGRHAVLLAPTRARAEVLRDRAAFLLGGLGGGVPRVRTPASWALSILTTFLTRRPDPLPAPVLLAGAEEDAALASLLREQDWPGLPRQTVGSRAFRSELRNLLARCGELGVDADTLAAWGRVLGVELWGPASGLLRLWDEQGRPSASRRSEVRKMDSARLQDRAVEALALWQQDGVTEPPERPDLVIVDDYQDCTAATSRLLGAVASPDGRGRSCQVVVLGDPDVAVETFRGGSPSLLLQAEDRSGLSAMRLVLGTCHRGGEQLAAVCADQASRLPVVGSAAHRRPVVPAGSEQERTAPGSEQAPDARAGGAPAGVVPIVASDPSQEVAHVARLLRSERVRVRTPWEQMAVIVRSAGQVRAVAAQLRRSGVPVTISTSAVLLRAEPAAAALLDVAAAALDGALGLRGPVPDRGAALALLLSPLVGLSTLDLRRLRRRLRADHPAQGTPDESLLHLLGSPAEAQALLAELAEEPLADQARRLEGAARVVEALRDVLRGPSGETASRQDHRVDVEELLWSAWHASGQAEQWRARALEGSASVLRSEGLLADAAEHDLDVVTTLFKRAEVWAERHPGAEARDFLTELAEELLPSDSVAPQGVRPEGVSVLTPAAAAGRQWELVAVMGLERDSWPDLRLRDSLTRTDLLVDAVTGRLPVGGDGKPDASLDPVTARAQVRADERRMFLAALSRASRRCVITATSTSQTEPSSFFYEVARAAGYDLRDSDGDPVVAEEVGDLTLAGLVAELRQAAVRGQLPGAGQQERDRGQAAVTILGHLAARGVASADPRSWAGVGGPSSMEPLTAPGKTVRLSPSTVASITQCPLQWFLQRNGGSSGTGAPQRLGTLIHAIAEQAQREGLRGQDLQRLLDQRLPELGYPDTWLGQVAKDHAHKLLTHLDGYLSSVPGAVDVERSIEVDLELAIPPERAVTDLDGIDGTDGAAPATSVRVRIGGRLDRVEYLDGLEPSPGAPGSPLPAGQSRPVRVIDLKTGKTKPEDAEHHAQLATYRAALQARGYEVLGAGLVLLGASPSRGAPALLVPAGAVIAPSPDPDTGEDWASAMLAGAALDVSGARLQARTGRHCTSCAVRSSCPAQPEGRSVAS